MFRACHPKNKQGPSRILETRGSHTCFLRLDGELLLLKLLRLVGLGFRLHQPPAGSCWVHHLKLPPYRGFNVLDLGLRQKVVAWNLIPDQQPCTPSTTSTFNEGHPQRGLQMETCPMQLKTSSPELHLDDTCKAVGTHADDAAALTLVNLTLEISSQIKSGTSMTRSACVQPNCETTCCKR